MMGNGHWKYDTSITSKISEGLGNDIYSLRDHDKMINTLIKIYEKSTPREGDLSLLKGIRKLVSDQNDEVDETVYQGWVDAHSKARMLSELRNYPKKLPEQIPSSQEEPLLHDLQDAINQIPYRIIPDDYLSAWRTMGNLGMQNLINEHVYRDLERSERKSILKVRRLGETPFEDILPGAPEMAETVMRGLDREICLMQLFDVPSIAALSGGGVGRLTFVEDDRRYVFKIESSFERAYKSCRIGWEIQKEAEKGNLGAKILCERMPRIHSDYPIEYRGRYVFLQEDVSEKVLPIMPLEIKYVQRAIAQGIDPNLVRVMYTMALLHEVISDMHLRDPILGQALSRQNYPLDEVRERLGKRLFTELRYRGNIDEDIEALAKIDRIQLIHSDLKPANWMKGFLLDTGQARPGTELFDIATVLLDCEETMKNIEEIKKYAEIYTEMRKEMNPHYAHGSDFAELLLRQYRLNAVRAASNIAIANGSEDKVLRFLKRAG